MPPKVTETLWKKIMSNVRDIVFIILFLASIVGWIRSETVKNTKLETKVQELTVAIEKQNSQLEKINQILLDQNELNGKIIMYMQMK